VIAEFVVLFFCRVSQHSDSSAVSFMATYLMMLGIPTFVSWSVHCWLPHIGNIAVAITEHLKDQVLY